MKRNFGISIRYGRIFSTLVSGMVLAAIVSVALSYGSYLTELVLGGAGVLVFYPPLLVVFKATNRELLEELRHLSNRMPVLEQAISYFCSYTEFFMGILDTK